MSATALPDAGLRISKRAVWILGLVFCLIVNVALLMGLVQLWSWLDQFPQLRMGLVMALGIVIAVLRLATQMRRVLRVSPAARSRCSLIDCPLSCPLRGAGRGFANLDRGGRASLPRVLLAPSREIRESATRHRGRASAVFHSVGT